jgi:hypothetical protein
VASGRYAVLAGADRGRSDPARGAGRSRGGERGAAAGVDTVDQALDLWVEPDGSWAWKDLDEFAERTGHPLYWDKTEAARIREVGERLAELAASRSFPFDGTWTDFRPDPDWPTAQRPEGWDLHRAHCQVP